MEYYQLFPETALALLQPGCSSMRLSGSGVDRPLLVYTHSGARRCSFHNPSKTRPLKSCNWLTVRLWPRKVLISPPSKGGFCLHQIV